MNLSFLNDYKHRSFFMLSELTLDEEGRTKKETWEQLRLKCDVPGEGFCGVYIVSACYAHHKEVVYIGSSGHMSYDPLSDEAGTIACRREGLWRRIIGRHRGLPKGTWLTRLQQETQAEDLEVAWYAWDETLPDNPLFVEYCLILDHLMTHGEFPRWNHELKIAFSLKDRLRQFMRTKQII